MSHFQVTQRMVNKAVLAERVGGWRKLWWKRTACFTDEAALREFEGPRGGRPLPHGPSVYCSLISALFRLRCLSLWMSAPTPALVCLLASILAYIFLAPVPHADRFGSLCNHWLSRFGGPISGRKWVALIAETHMHMRLHTECFFFRFYHSGGFPICWHNIKICAQDLHDCFHIKHSQLRGWAGGM